MDPEVVVVLSDGVVVQDGELIIKDASEEEALALLQEALERKKAMLHALRTLKALIELVGL